MVNIDQINFENKCVVIRVDFNVPLDDNFNITDDSRIRAALPTINKVLNDKGMVVLMSHLGRPKKNPDPKYSIKPIIKHLEELLGRPVQFADDCMKDANQVATMKPGEVIVLEYPCFYAEEEGKPPGIDKGEGNYDDAKKAIKASQKDFTKILASNALIADYFVMFLSIITVLMTIIGAFPRLSLIISCFEVLCNILILIARLFVRHNKSDCLC